MPRTLTHKQKCFALEYLVDLNATQAAIRAGYSAKNAGKIGPELIGNTRVKDAVQTLIGERAKKIRRDALDVLKDIQEVAREARSAGDLKTALKGLELEAKHLGMFSEKIEHAGEVAVKHEISPALNDFLHLLKGGPLK